jgi:ATP-dependent DNA helicase RecG
MSGRPEILFPLFSEITKLSGIGPKIAQNLAKLNIQTPRDLLFTLPQSVVVRNLIKTVSGVPVPSIVTVQITVAEHLENTRKDRPYRIAVSDGVAEFQLVFFHPRKNWLRENYPIGGQRVISGKIEMFDHMLQMTHPDYVCKSENITDIPKSEPIYPLTAGVTQKNLAKASQQVLDRLHNLEEWIDPALIEKYDWPSWKYAIEKSHRPEKKTEISPHSPSRQRLAYDELFSHQLTLAIARSGIRKSKGIETVATGRMSAKIRDCLPFTPTNAQLRVIDEIGSDMAAPFRMNRLLQGDVGSGKTLVAMMAMTGAVEAGGQAVMMAPTEILAQQHLAGLRPLAEQAGIVLESLTGRDKGSERKAKLEALASGKIHILVGTHAVFQKTVMFNDLRLAVIDEQHRFGVRERMDLGAKGKAVDILVMTATPIPRSLALANYGDMDISVLDEKPAGRKPIDTVLVSNTRMTQVVERLMSAIGQGRQAYWVCPLVEESDALNLVAAEDRSQALKLALGEGNVGLVHGRMSSIEKDDVMGRFQTGEIQVLVATTVIEVGVDVPNASIIVIEHAERFGLSQLHQLRGRVGRGSEASTCLLMYVAPLGQTAQKRLEAIRETNDGFEISEVDLKLRGAGDVLGVAQSGLPRFRVADIETQTDLLNTAQKDARMILMKDPTLVSERGQAIRTLLHLMEADKYIRLLSVG